MVPINHNKALSNHIFLESESYEQSRNDIKIVVVIFYALSNHYLTLFLTYTEGYWDIERSFDV